MSNGFQQNGFTQQEYDDLLAQIDLEKQLSSTMSGFMSDSSTFRSRSSNTTSNGAEFQDSVNDSKMSEGYLTIDNMVVEDLKDAYIGCRDDFKPSIRDKKKIDFGHRQYFGAHLKEQSLINALNMEVLKDNRVFSEEYTQFYKDMLFEPEKKNLFSMFSKITLPLNDSQFFENVLAIQKYIHNGDVSDIGGKVDDVLNHRRTYVNMLPVDERTGIVPADLKTRICDNRYKIITAEFEKAKKTNSGFMYMHSEMDCFVTELEACYSDFNIKISGSKRKEVSDMFETEYKKVLDNPRISAQDKAQIKQDKLKTLNRLYAI